MKEDCFASNRRVVDYYISQKDRFTFIHLIQYLVKKVSICNKFFAKSNRNFILQPPYIIQDYLNDLENVGRIKYNFEDGLYEVII